jgi:glycosyltransferase involved in cell wall biosynthesis
METVKFQDLPAPPAGRIGWPWTEAAAPLPPKMADGSPWPKISLVTPSFNQGAFIEETIRSVLAQGYPNLEYIIIDGGSTDETVDIIRKYEPFINCWVREPDHGQSHAINKGIARCSGEVFNWLNSDDLLCPGALKAVAETWRRRPNHVVAGVEIDFEEDGSEREIVSQHLTLRNFVHWRSACKERMQWGQPVTFLPMAAVSQAGGVREDLRYSMDHLLMIEVLQHYEVAYIPARLARFRIHRKSKTRTAGHARFRLERMDAIRAMKSLPVEVPASAMRADYARTLVGCAREDCADRHRWSAMKRLLKAVWISPSETISAVMDFRWPTHLCSTLTVAQRLLRKLHSVRSCVGMTGGAGQ